MKIIAIILALALAASGYHNYRQHQEIIMHREQSAKITAELQELAADVPERLQQIAAAMAMVERQEKAAQELLAAVKENGEEMDRLRAENEELRRPRITVTRQSDYAAPVRAAPRVTPRPAAAPSLTSITTAARRHAERYFNDGRKNGSGQTLVFAMDIDTEPPRQVPGWTGRYEVKGRASYNYYESIRGGAFNSDSRSFTCYVENGQVIDFTPGF